MATQMKRRRARPQAPKQWGLAYPGLGLSTDDEERGPGVHGHLAPEARRRPGVVHEGAGAGRLARPAGRIVLGEYDEARAHPDGPLVRRQDSLLPRARQRRVHAVLRIPVRQLPGEVLRRLRSQREAEPGRRSGGSASVARPVRTRRCTTSWSTSRAGRSRPWRSTTSPRGSASHRSTRPLTATRRRRSSSVRLPRATAHSRRRSKPSCRSWPQPFEPVTSGAQIDLDVGSEWQYEETRNQREG